MRVVKRAHEMEIAFCGLLATTFTTHCHLLLKKQKEEEK
jgi:hypothetical protein